MGSFSPPHVSTFSPLLVLCMIQVFGSMNFSLVNCMYLFAN